MNAIYLCILMLIEIVLLDLSIRKYSTLLFWSAVLLSWFCTAKYLFPS